MFFRRFVNHFFCSTFVLLVAILASCSDISEKKASLVVTMPASARAAKDNVAEYEVALHRMDFQENFETENVDHEKLEAEMQKLRRVVKPGESVFFDEIDEGEYSVIVHAFDKDYMVLAYGDATAKVVAGQTSNVSVTLKSVSDEQPTETEEEAKKDIIYIEINYDTYTTKLTFSKSDDEYTYEKGEMFADGGATLKVDGDNLVLHVVPMEECPDDEYDIVVDTVNKTYTVSNDSTYGTAITLKSWYVNDVDISGDWTLRS